MEWFNEKERTLFILGKEVATTFHCSDGKGEDFTLNRIGVLVLVERCILQADGFRLTSQDLTIKTGRCCDAVQLLSKRV